MRIGIFFGGQSREREISYLGGRTAYENLDKTLFEPVPIFVDSFGNFILLQTEYLYKNSLREFYGSLDHKGFAVYVESLALSAEEIDKLINNIGTKILPQNFSNYFDFAFLALHGQGGEDGSLQGLLEWYNMPYSGCGILSSAVGIDKIIQNQWIANITGQNKASSKITWNTWKNGDKATIFENIKQQVGFPFVAKAPHQGSSIGVAIIKNNNIDEFIAAMHRCFFVVEIAAKTWNGYNQTQKHSYLQNLTDLDKGIGFPMYVPNSSKNNIIIEHPVELEMFLNGYFATHTTNLTIFSKDTEEEILLEEFITGQEFSCGVLQDDNGNAIALPPTEIISASSFDFDSKYKAGGSRKVIPIQSTDNNILAIQEAVSKIFTQLHFQVCARIDGFLTADNRVVLHDPNTIPGMSPSSLIFKQTAEIGLNVSQTLTYFIIASLQQRKNTGKNTTVLRNSLQKIEDQLAENKQSTQNQQCLYIDFEATEADFLRAKKEYAKAASNGQYKLQARLQTTLSNGESRVYLVPFALLMRETFAEMFEILQLPRHQMLEKTAENAKKLVEKYLIM